MGSIDLDLTVDVAAILERDAAARSAAEALADLKMERGGVEARAATAESEAMPLRYSAELHGLGGDDDKAIRLLIAPVP